MVANFLFFFVKKAKQIPWIRNHLSRVAAGAVDVQGVLINLSSPSLDGVVTNRRKVALYTRQGWRHGRSSLSMPSSSSASHFVF